MDLTVISACFLNILLRSSLNIFDRFLFGKKSTKFFFLYFILVAFPCLIGIALLLQMGGLEYLWHLFTSPTCILLSISTQLVGLSFSYAFKKHEVRHVILQAKLPDLFLPFLLAISLWTQHNQVDALTWKKLVPLAITWIGILPLIRRKDQCLHFFNKTTIFVCASSLLQIFFSSRISIESNTFVEIIALTTAILMWRSIFSIPLCLINKQTTTENERILSPYLLKFILPRSLFSFATQLTFTWCILKGAPLVIWPILNMTPLVAAAASHVILKEKVSLQEQFALCGFVLGTSISLAL